MTIGEAHGPLQGLMMPAFSNWSTLSLVIFLFNAEVGLGRCLMGLEVPVSILWGSTLAMATSSRPSAKMSLN